MTQNISVMSENGDDNNNKKHSFVDCACFSYSYERRMRRFNTTDNTVAFIHR